MDNINSKCNDITKEYKEKYNRLLSLVDGYEVANNNQNESMKSLANIINNTKELISESEFENLKKEQKNIMQDFARLEEMKDDPYSEESIEFSKKRNPQKFIQEEIEEEQEEKIIKKKPQKFIQEEIEEKEERKDKSNNLTNKIKNMFSLDNINELRLNKNKNKKNGVQEKDKEEKEEKEEEEVQEISRENRIQPYNQQKQIIPNFYSDGNKKYDIYSNFVPSQNQQIPTIQIVNVQEAPKPKQIDLQKKSKLKEPNLKKNVDNFLNKSFKTPGKKMYSSQKNINPKISFKKNKNKNKKNKKTKTSIDHFKDFLNDYTENIRFKKKKQNIPEKKSKKCKKSSFINPISNLSNNHNIFK